MNLRAWVTDVAVRAIKTAAQTAVGLLAVNTTGLLTVDWQVVGSVAGLAALTCILQNLTTLDLSAAPMPVVAPVAKPTAGPMPAPVMAPLVARSANPN